MEVGLRTAFSLGLRAGTWGLGFFLLRPGKRIHSLGRSRSWGVLVGPHSEDVSLNKHLHGEGVSLNKQNTPACRHLEPDFRHPSP